MEGKVEVKMPAYYPSLGWVIGCSRRGQSHIIINKVCQDAYSTWTGSFSGKPCLIVAIADGHGGDKYDLSQYGSSLAVKVAIDVLLEFFINFCLESEDVYLKYFKSDYPTRVVRRWRESVENHAKKFGCNIEPENINSLYTRYGTTLQVILVSDDVVLMAKIGDGDILYIDEEDQDVKIISPFEVNKNLIGSETNSLSSKNAQFQVQTTAFKTKQKMKILMSTDGLSDSFGDSNDEFCKFFKSLVSNLNTVKIDQLNDTVPKWLDYYSKEGSGDDITLAVIGINSSYDHPVKDIEDWIDVNDFNIIMPPEYYNFKESGDIQ